MRSALLNKASGEKTLVPTSKQLFYLMWDVTKKDRKGGLTFYTMPKCKYFMQVIRISKTKT